MRYFFHITYNGYNYHGWQKHKPHTTIQETIETNIAKLLKTPVTIFGCGRTDAQVHASQYYFHLDLTTDMINDDYKKDFIFRLNKILPDDISVYEIIHVANKYHAQFNAVKRTYNYYIHTHKSPFLSRCSYLYQDKKINTKNIKQAITLLTQYKDYKAFCKSPEKYEHTICNVTSAKIFRGIKVEELRIEISSNRFLRGMMRAIIYRLIEVGTGKISFNEFENFLISKKHHSNIKFAPPHGLYLTEVIYPFLNLHTKAAPIQNCNKGTKWRLV